MKKKPCWIRLSKNILHLMFWVVFFVFLTGGIFFATQNVLAFPEITNKTGETWIEWDWNFINTTVYVDGKLKINDSDIGYYLLSDLQSNEVHKITLIDNDNSTTLEQETKTKPKMLVGNTVYLIIFAIVFIVIGLKMPLFCLLGVILAFYGGIINANATTEGWIIITYFLVGIFALVEFSMELMEK